MEELLFALLVWIGRQLARGYRHTRDWLQGKKQSREEARVRRPQAEVPGTRSTAASAESPLRAARDALAERARQVRDQATRKAAELGAATAPPLLSQALEQGVAAPADRIRDAAARLPLLEESEGELDRLEGQLEPLERLVVDLSEWADQRGGDRDRALLAADRALTELRAPLEQWARHRPGVTLPEPAPVAVHADPDALDPALARVGLPVAALPRSFPREPYAWAALARALGRDLWRRVPGLQRETHQRLGLPNRYPVPFVSRGYWGPEEIGHPYGPWLETLWGDLVAAWLLGPAAGAALVPWIAQPEQPSRAVVVPVDESGTLYAETPPPHLRLAFTTAALTHLGFGAEARALWSRWLEYHGQPQVLYVPTRLEGWLAAPLQPFETMAHRVARGLLQQPLVALGGHSLSGMEGVAFDEGTQSRAEAVADALASGAAPPAATSGAVRLAGALVARQRAGAGRAGPIARWLRSTFGPAGSRAAAERPRAVATAATGATLRGRHEPRVSAALFRDAVVLNALLSRRPSRAPGAPPPYRR